MSHFTNSLFEEVYNMFYYKLKGNEFKTSNGCTVKTKPDSKDIPMIIVESDNPFIHATIHAGYRHGREGLHFKTSHTTYDATFSVTSEDLGLVTITGGFIKNYKHTKWGPEFTDLEEIKTLSYALTEFIGYLIGPSGGYSGSAVGFSDQYGKGGDEKYTVKIINIPNDPNTILNVMFYLLSNLNISNIDTTYDKIKEKLPKANFDSKFLKKINTKDSTLNYTIEFGTNSTKSDLELNKDTLIKVVEKEPVNLFNQVHKTKLIETEPQIKVITEEPKKLINQDKKESNEIYKTKYLKYKQKYLELKKKFTEI